MTQITVPSDKVFDVLQSNILVDGFHLVIDLKKSHGSVMVDALEGKEYLDCYSGVTVMSAGHNHPEITAAIIEGIGDELLPETTEGREPYLHPYIASGDVTKVELKVLVRAF